MSSRHADAHFEDMLQAIALIQKYAGDITFAVYQTDDLRRSAIERQMSILSEAATRLRDTAEILCPGPDWPRIKSLGNVLRHEYQNIVDRIIWDAIETKLPSLKVDVTAALQRYLDTTPR